MSNAITIAINKQDTLAAIHKKPEEQSLANFNRKLILLIHGFPGHKSGHSDLYADLEYILTDRGFHTLRFDFLGCGKSSGHQKDFTLRKAKESLDAVKRWAIEKGYKELIFISEGLGSTIAMLNMEFNLKCQVMLWPGLDPQFLAKNLFHADKIPEQSFESGYDVQDYNYISIDFIKELSKMNLKPFFRDIVMPVLILHGSEDARYPIEQLNIARREMASKRIEIMTFHEGRHGLPELRHRKAMFSQISEFLEKFA